MATPVQFLRILNVLQPDTADRAHLLRRYERERVGEEKFAKYEKVRSFLRRLSEGADDVGGDICILYHVSEIVYQTAGRLCYTFLSPSG